MTTYETIETLKSDHIATITLNRPERRNAITDQMGRELLEALDSFDRDDGVRVIVLTGAGTSFCAGADLSKKEIGGRMEPDFEAGRQMYRRIFQAITQKIFDNNKPVIAMLNGPAVATGFDMAMACDIRIGCEHTRLRVRFTSIGGITAPGGSWLLVHTLGLPKAAELVFADEFVQAEEARELGLLNKLVPAEKLEQETMALAQKIAAHDPIAIRLQKVFLHLATKMDFGTYLEAAAMGQAGLQVGGGLSKGIASFKERT
ncbi:enoyl-CoA hydratase/isomerase family protein [Thermodesulfobacteriota bacterium]